MWTLRDRSGVSGLVLYASSVLLSSTGVDADTVMCSTYVYVKVGNPDEDGGPKGNYTLRTDWPENSCDDGCFYQLSGDPSTAPGSDKGYCFKMGDCSDCERGNLTEVPRTSTPRPPVTTTAPPVCVNECPNLDKYVQKHKDKLVVKCSKKSVYYYSDSIPSDQAKHEGDFCSVACKDDNQLCHINTRIKCAAGLGGKLAWVLEEDPRHCIREDFFDNLCTSTCPPFPDHDNITLNCDESGQKCQLQCKKGMKIDAKRWDSVECKCGSTGYNWVNSGGDVVDLMTYPDIKLCALTCANLTFPECNKEWNCYSPDGKPYDDLPGDRRELALWESGNRRLRPEFYPLPEQAQCNLSCKQEVTLDMDITSIVCKEDPSTKTAQWFDRRNVARSVDEIVILSNTPCDNCHRACRTLYKFPPKCADWVCDHKQCMSSDCVINTSHYPPDTSCKLKCWNATMLDTPIRTITCTGKPEKAQGANRHWEDVSGKNYGGYEQKIITEIADDACGCGDNGEQNRGWNGHSGKKREAGSFEDTVAYMQDF